jgi:hypothetical protein
MGLLATAQPSFTTLTRLNRLDDGKRHGNRQNFGQAFPADFTI